MTEIFGVGPIVAAMLIGYSGDPTRFATATAPAAATTTASSPSDTPHARRSAALKRQLSDVVWRHLLADARRAGAD